jgi:DNA-binding transcriptional MerR regulator
LTLELPPECILILEASDVASGALQIGALSKQSGLSIDAIRFYERERLLRSPRRSVGGFRLFGEEDLVALRFIRSAQELGFSLDEIRELLGLRSDQARACPKMRALLQTKLGSVERKIASLKMIRTELKVALTKCETELGGEPEPRLRACPVLDEFSEKSRKRRKP